MSMYTKISADVLSQMQIDAGVLLSKFDVNDVENLDETSIICPTTGGVKATCIPEYIDLGADYTDCPKDSAELKYLKGWTCGIGFTALSVTKETIRLALGAADVNASTGAIVPRKDVELTDFADVWWVGARMDGGVVAVQLIDALSTNGFNLTTSDSEKGQVSVELTGHTSIDEQDRVPMIIYSISTENYLIVNSEVLMVNGNPVVMPR